MEKILIVDTADREETVVGLRIAGRTHYLKGKRISSQILLPLIDKILKKHHLQPQDLTGIEVNLGPGSFTGLRVGAAVANTLSSFLKVPINGKSGYLAQPRYNP
ncbi:MAG: tRNA (adenosine(37)-N6)-threonylcarbamoyltransferase complex dimerization subunit type 1 TsaB [bacterium]|nr:tRNA (adenosine(37)-N6)-threonylcarbamoyltransferase complex dimerization subunit type 1 TsaB [bacterium]